jgi:hypothetical protein
VKKIARQVLLILVGVLAVSYVCDWIVVRMKMGGAHPTALGEVSVYYSTELKSGKMDVYYHDPVNQTCVHSLFPHFGYSPCWYLSKHNVQVIQ